MRKIILSMFILFFMYGSAIGTTGQFRSASDMTVSQVGNAIKLVIIDENSNQSSNKILYIKLSKIIALDYTDSFFSFVVSPHKLGRDNMLSPFVYEFNIENKDKMEKVFEKIAQILKNYEE